MAEQQATDKVDAPAPVVDTITSVETTESAAPVADGSANAGPSSVASSSTTPLGPDGQPLSKKAQKRLAKRAYYESTKLEKRAEERQRRKERAAYLKAGYEAGTLTPKEREIVEAKRELKRARRTKAEPWPGSIVIDLKFDELMLDAELKSMASQVRYVYSDTRSASRPFTSVLFTGFSPETTPRLWEQMNKDFWQKWNGVHFRAEDIDVLQQDLAKLEAGGTEEKPDGDQPGAPAAEQEEVDKPEQPAEGTKEAAEEDRTQFLCGSKLPPGFTAGRQLVYLSADSEEELETLSPDEIYIIGGIVDHNRHKMLCQNKAEQMGIRTARLPIGKYIENLPTRKVLTVNQVFAILLQYNALGDWAKAFEEVIPQRKYTEKGKRNRRQPGKEGQSEEPENGMDVDVQDEEAALNAGAGAEDEEAAMNVGAGAEDEEAAMNVGAGAEDEEAAMNVGAGAEDEEAAMNA